MGTTDIQWTDSVWNPVRGCSRVSPGCDNCYAMRQAHRFNTPSERSPYHGLTIYREGGSRPGVDWSGKVRLVLEMLAAPLKWRKPRRVFVNSMSDLFHESLSNEEIASVFGVMAACPQHTFQVLTKRARRMREWFEWVARDYITRSINEGTHCVGEAQRLIPEDIGSVNGFALDWPLSNVWLGVSAENQKTADDRISELLVTPASVRFVSAEPLLEEVSLWAFLDSKLRNDSLEILRSQEPYPVRRLPGIDWVIVGGESGNGARPCHVNWISNIVSQCRAAGVPCFVKQLGSFPDASDEDGPGLVHLRDRKGGDMSEWPESMRVRQFPELRS